MEITALVDHTDIIENTVTIGGAPRWFGNKLVEKGFLTRRDANNILDPLGVPPLTQASQLMKSVYAKIESSAAETRRQWFHKFVDIFSRDAAYADLVSKLRDRVYSENGARGKLAI